MGCGIKPRPAPSRSGGFAASGRVAAGSAPQPACRGRRANTRLAPPKLPGVSQALPELLDCKRIMEECGVRRATAEAMTRRLPVVHFPGLRKVFVKRSDLLALIEEHTYEKSEVPRPGHRGKA